MRDKNAAQLLAQVMEWRDEASVLRCLPRLQLLAEHKYDHYQRFGPGRRFIESLALWLNQFEAKDRTTALALVLERLVFISEQEFSHLVQTAYPDVIVQERIRLVAEEQDIPTHRVRRISQHPRFEELRHKSLYLGLSDGARTSELRRSSRHEIGNEQIWQAYELGEEKADDMLTDLRYRVKDVLPPGTEARFNLIWLLDDFSGSGNTYIRYDSDAARFKGKIPKIYDRLHRGDLVDTSHYEVFLLLYAATRKAIDHIEYWAERFTSQQGFKPLQLRVLLALEHEVALTSTTDEPWEGLLANEAYWDSRVVDRHFRVGGTEDGRLGFAGCALPLVLSHNTPNNSVYILWGPDSYTPFGLFPRMSRHREF